MKKALAAAALAFVLFGGAAQAQIVNGGFETGDFTGWTIYGVNDPPFVSGTSPIIGSFSAVAGSLSGGEPGGDSAFYQQIAVPASVTTLQFRTVMATTDTISFDWQDAYILDSSGNNLATIFHVCQNQGDTLTTFDMTPYASQTVRVAFLVHQDAFGDLTSMKIDGVVLNVSSVPEPTTIALGAVGLCGAGFVARRRRRSRKIAFKPAAK